MTKIKTFEELYEAVKELYPDAYYYKKNQIRFGINYSNLYSYKINYFSMDYTKKRYQKYCENEIVPIYRLSMLIGKKSYYSIIRLCKSYNNDIKDPQKIYSIIKAIWECENE